MRFSKPALMFLAFTTTLAILILPLPAPIKMVLVLLALSVQFTLIVQTLPQRQIKFASHLPGESLLAASRIFNIESSAAKNSTHGSLAEASSSEVAKYPHILFKLKNYMTETEAFRKPRLKIELVAQAIDEPSYLISRAINQICGMRFTDLVNSYRLRYVEEKVRSGGLRHYTLEYFAIEAGFSSRTTFFNSVRRTHDVSPTEYFLKLKPTIAHRHDENGQNN